jgi:hypothetical protein
MALFESMARVDATHVPYKGGAPAVTDLVAGRISLMMANLTTAQPSHPLGPAARAGRGHEVALAALPRDADNRRIGRARLQGEQLERRRRAGRHAARGSSTACTATSWPCSRSPSSSSAWRHPRSSDRRHAEEFARYIRSEGRQGGKLVKTAGIKPE